MPSCALKTMEVNALTTSSEEQGCLQGNLGPSREGTRNALVTILTGTAEQSLLKRRQEAGYNIALVPDTEPASELNQKSLNKYSRHLSVLRERAG